MADLESAAYAERLCPSCGKRLARLNPGPTCYACEPLARNAPQARAGPPRRHLPYDEIISLYREIGNLNEVARRLALPRSSVWDVLHRAQRGERNGGGEAPTR